MYLMYLHNTSASQCSQVHVNPCRWSDRSVARSHPGTLSLAKVCCSRCTSWPQIAAHTGAPPRANTAVDLSHRQTAARRLHDSQHGVDSGRTVDKPNSPASVSCRGRDLLWQAANYQITLMMSFFFYQCFKLFFPFFPFRYAGLTFLNVFIYLFLFYLSLMMSTLRSWLEYSEDTQTTIDNMCLFFILFYFFI